MTTSIGLFAHYRPVVLALPAGGSWQCRNTSVVKAKKLLIKP
jgi:hypothetical protein